MPVITASMLTAVHKNGKHASAPIKPKPKKEKRKTEKESTKGRCGEDSGATEVEEGEPASLERRSHHGEWARPQRPSGRGTRGVRDGVCAKTHETLSCFLVLLS